MEEERDWVDEEKRLTAIYIRRGYLKEVAEDMAQREIGERKIECGLPVESEDAGEEVSEKTKPKLVKSQKKGAKK